jgi:hypothetical protein
MTTTPEAVKALADIFADAEVGARQTKDAFRSARKLLDEIRANGDAGALITQKFAGRMDALATQFEADLWSLHEEITLAAAGRSIDVPTLRDGGDR